VIYALNADSAAAESVFMSVLSRSPGNPCAYNNLGNLHLQKGRVQVALRLYHLAEQGDSTDAGIVLNEATAELMQHNDEAAAERAAVGVRMAGGPSQAASLLGLTYYGPPSSKEAGPTYLSKEEIEALLRETAGRVPTDSTRAQTSAPKKDKKGGIPVWRRAGPRANDGTPQIALTYWKR